MPKAELLAVAPETANEASAAGTAAQRTLDQLRAMPVTQANMDLVGAILVDVKTKYKELDARLKSITAPMRAAEKSVRDLFRPALNALAEAEAVLKKGIADAQRAQWAQNQEMQQKAQAALAVGDARGAALAVHALEAVVSPAGVNVREVVAFRVIDPALVPRELCSPDDAKIKAAVAAGYREIPGVLIGLESVVSVRT